MGKNWVLLRNERRYFNTEIQTPFFRSNLEMLSMRNPHRKSNMSGQD